MSRLGEWLKSNGKTQRWAAGQLEIYDGYLSKLISGRSVASTEVCERAVGLMRPAPVEASTTVAPVRVPAGRISSPIAYNSATVVQATVKIVMALIEEQKDMTVDDLVRVVRSVRSALASP